MSDRLNRNVRTVPAFELFWPQVGLIGLFLSLDGIYFTFLFYYFTTNLLFWPSQVFVSTGFLICAIYLYSVFLVDKRKLSKRRQVAVNPREIGLAVEIGSVIGCVLVGIFDLFILLYVWPY